MAARRSTRRRFDDEGWQAPHPTAHRLTGRTAPPDGLDGADDQALPEPAWSTYRDSTHGPQPVPPWVVTDPRAIDDDRGVMKSGKEADVSLVERRVAPDHSAECPGDATACLLAVKRYRSAEHRMFHRDAGYLEGRRV